MSLFETPYRLYSLFLYFIGQYAHDYTYVYT